ncbi:cbb3-type cytochrome oxidase assembly protein CcoS [Thioalkalivibrio sp.]|uniref:cbb3-type cytochrome oxidase assembly protein CcoS n=1 Tax=Thioalkalivibrio sp. TaxID=2093813 RepID=UPI0039754D8A
MEVLYLLIPIALVLVLIIGIAFFWAIRSGQYEDMEGPAHRILMDDDDPLIPGNEDRARERTSEDGERNEDHKP